LVFLRKQGSEETGLHWPSCCTFNDGGVRFRVGAGHSSNPSAKQRAVLVQLREFNPSHADMFESSEFVQLEDAKVLLRGRVGASDIAVVDDVNRDCVLDFLLTSGFTNAGYLVENESVVALAGAQVRTMKELGNPDEYPDRRQTWSQPSESEEGHRESRA
jgi:hypothetical protein